MEQQNVRERLRLAFASTYLATHTSTKEGSDHPVQVCRLTQVFAGREGYSLSFAFLFSSQCSIGYAGDGTVCNRDTDLDGAPDVGLPCTDRRCRQVTCCIDN